MQYLPKWIAIEVTRKCNLKCIHCRSASTIESESGVWNLEKIKNLYQSISKLSKPTIVLTGGEPLLHEEIFDMIEEGNKFGFRMCLATNGTLIDEEIAKKLKKLNIKMVSLSLDGSTAEVHDNFRQQKGAFEGVMRAIEILKKYNIPFLINSSFTKRNAFDIPNIYKLMKKIKPTAWYMFLILPVGRGDEAEKELLSPEEAEEWLRWHFAIETVTDEFLVRPTCAPHYYRICEEEAEKLGLNYKRRNLTLGTGGSKGCVAGQYICFIDAFGGIRPCSYWPENIDNVFNKPFDEIWLNNPLLKNLRDKSAYKGKCGSCKYFEVCSGCRVRAYAKYKDYLAEDPYCFYNPLKSN